MTKRGNFFKNLFYSSYSPFRPSCMSAKLISAYILPLWPVKHGLTASGPVLDFWSFSAGGPLCCALLSGSTILLVSLQALRPANSISQLAIYYSAHNELKNKIVLLCRGTPKKLVLPPLFLADKVCPEFEKSG